MADSRLLRVRPWARAALPKSDLLSARASKNSSPATNWSPRLIASFSAACKSETRSRPTCTWSCPWTSGSFFSAASATANKPAWLTPARCNKALGPSSWCSMAATTCAGSMNAWSLPRARVWASDSASWNLVVSLSIRMRFSGSPAGGALAGHFQARRRNCALRQRCLLGYPSAPAQHRPTHGHQPSVRPGRFALSSRTAPGFSGNP